MIKRGRIEWMDTLRGLMIILVILQHWIYGAKNLDPEILSNSFYECIAYLTKILAPIRMEILFFLSGMISLFSVKKDKKTFMMGKIKTLLYPYLSWSLIYLLLFNAKKIINGDLGGTAEYLIKILVGCPDLTWFLAYLFLSFLFIYFFNEKKINPFIVYGFCFLMIISLKNNNMHTSLEVDYLKDWDFFYYLMYFYTGFLLAKRKIDMVHFSKNRTVILLSFISLLIVEYINFHLKQPKTSLLYFPFVIMSLPVIILLSRAIGNIRVLNKGLVHVSTNSIYYYLMQFIFMGPYMSIFKFLNIPPSIYLPLLPPMVIYSTYAFLRIKNTVVILDILFRPNVRVKQPLA